MGVKTITIRDEVYRRLLHIKGPRESFSDVLDRLSRRSNIDDFFGALSDRITEKDVEEWKRSRDNWVRAFDS